MPSFYHVLVTIFNVRYMLDSDLDKMVAWTQERIPLFEKYCLPSVMAQSNKNFDWLIVIDPYTPKSLRDKMKSWENQEIPIHFIEYEDVDLVEIAINEFIQRQNKDVDYIITSRLDNDDLLHQEFIGSVQNYFLENQSEGLLNFINGYSYLLRKNKNGMVFSYRAPHNPFMSLIEKNKRDLLTIRKYIHNDWPSSIQISNMETKYGLWLQLIHGKNQLNTFQGEAIAQPDFLQFFQMDNALATYQDDSPHKLMKMKQLIAKPLRKIKSIIEPRPY